MDETQAVAAAAQTISLGQVVRDNWPILLFGALVFALVLRWRLRRVDPLTKAHRRLTAEAVRFEASQGRVSAGQLVTHYPCPPAGLPLGYAPPAPWRPWRPWLRRPCRPVGIPWDADKGHLLVVAPSRSGKSFHQSDTLLRYPGPALVIDPKREQWRRTAGTRATRGPVYEVPAVGVDLAALFDLSREVDRRELFTCLWRPWLDKGEPFFTQATAPLLEAAYRTGLATEQNPIRLLARWSRMAAAAALAEAQPHAPAAVEQVTGGVSLDKLAENRTFHAVWMTFTSKWAPLVEAVDVLATAAAAGGVPADWAARNGTVYLTWPLHQQAAVGPLVAAVVAGLVRHLQARPAGKRALLSLDEAPAVAVPGLSHYLSTLGGAGSGVTACVYTQSLPALVAVYGPHEARSIVANCGFQVWHRPQDTESAEALSALFGEVCEVAWNASSGTNEGRSQAGGALVPGSYSSSANAGASLGTRYRPALNVAQAMALGDYEVIVLLRGQRSRVYSSYAVLEHALGGLPSPPVEAPPTAIPVAAPVPPAATSAPASPPPPGW